MIAQINELLAAARSPSRASGQLTLTLSHSPLRGARGPDLTSSPACGRGPGRGQAAHARPFARGLVCCAACAAGPPRCCFAPPARPRASGVATAPPPRRRPRAISRCRRRRTSANLRQLTSAVRTPRRTGRGRATRSSLQARAARARRATASSACRWRPTGARRRPMLPVSERARGDDLLVLPARGPAGDLRVDRGGRRGLPAPAGSQPGLRLGALSRLRHLPRQRRRLGRAAADRRRRATTPRGRCAARTARSSSRRCATATSSSTGWTPTARTSGG